MTNPAVSVLMAVYNGQPYVESALRSVMEQTLREIEIIVVDDASTDGTAEVLARLAAEDPRIRVERVTDNLGVAGAANHGLALARAPLVARMDADDLCAPERLARQKQFLDTHDEIALVSSSIEQIDDKDAPIRTSLRPRDAFACRWLGRFLYPLNHPASMFRRLRRDGTPFLYDGTLRVSLDYDFFARVMREAEAVSLPEVLLKYRVHKGSITGTKYRAQMAVAERVARESQKADLPAALCTTLEPFNQAYFGRTCPDAGAVFDAMRTLIAHDVAQGADTRRPWMARQGAQLVMTALQRAGLERSAQMRAFARHGRDFITPLLWRRLEVSGRLPAALSSDPPVWNTP